MEEMSEMSYKNLMRYQKDHLRLFNCDAPPADMFRAGYEAGREAGYEAGREAGYEAGYEAAQNRREEAVRRYFGQKESGE